MGKKFYISLEANPLSVDILVGGRLRSADFTGGLKHPIIVMPKFMTEDVELQKALEEYSGYGKSFILEKEEIEDVTIVTDLEESQTPDADTPVPSSFPNVKEAKTWFNKFKGISYGKMSTKEKLLAVASEFGVSLVFDNE